MRIGPRAVRIDHDVLGAAGREPLVDDAARPWFADVQRRRRDGCASANAGRAQQRVGRGDRQACGTRAPDRGSASTGQPSCCSVPAGWRARTGDDEAATTRKPKRRQAWRRRCRMRARARRRRDQAAAAPALSAAAVRGTRGSGAPARARSGGVAARCSARAASERHAPRRRLVGHAGRGARSACSPSNSRICSIVCGRTHVHGFPRTVGCRHEQRHARRGAPRRPPATVRPRRCRWW